MVPPQLRCEYVGAESVGAQMESFEVCLSNTTFLSYMKRCNHGPLARPPPHQIALAPKLEALAKGFSGLPAKALAKAGGGVGFRPSNFLLNNLVAVEGFEPPARGL